MPLSSRGTGGKGIATEKKLFMKLYLSYFKTKIKVPFATKLERG